MNLVLKLIILLNISHAQNIELASFTSVDQIENEVANIPKKGLKVVWWNIDCGLETSEVKIRSNLRTTNLEANLKKLTSSSFKPDVLILGEYCPYSMSEEDQRFLKDAFKDNHHVERNIPRFTTASGKVNQRNGFLILSDYPIDVLKEETLHAKEDKSDSRSDRKYILFKVQKNNQDFMINPVHLVNPWREIYNNDGLFGTFSEITYGSQNLNSIQIKNLLAKYNENKLSNTPYLMIGDFNSPGSLSGFSGWGFNQLNKQMDRLFSGHDDTFIGDGVFPSTDIDHAFGHSLESLYAEIWPLDGSRHLPLYVVIDAQ